MWDGWWFLVNRRAWAQLSSGIQESVSKILNNAAMEQRNGAAKQNTELKSLLAGEGLVFNDVDSEPFRAKLSQSGFYKDWRSKFGEAAWGLLEEASGKLD
jgi:TRAP-type transport system periplasmic protein